VNIPWVFDIMWRIIGPLIDPNTSKKVHILRGSSDFDKILEYIDEDQLEVAYGGKNLFDYRKNFLENNKP